MRRRKVLVVVLTNNVAVNMDKSENCMHRGSKTMNSNQLLCGRGIPCKDEGFERQNSLTPILLTIFIFYKFLYIKCMRIFFACIGCYILVRVVGVIHL